MYIMPLEKIIIVVTGHYGSGKTEFSVSLAMLLSHDEKLKYKRLAIIDLDIANPYFRSRERRDMLEKNGIKKYGSAYEHEITAELPALGASSRIPLEDEDCQVIVDLGGNADGAKVLQQFRKYFNTNQYIHLAVVNANRPDTRNIDGALEHLRDIEFATGLPVDAIVNNCHLLRETTADTIAKGHALCEEISKHTGKKIACDCYAPDLIEEKDLHDIGPYHMPIGLYMRPSWLDKLL